MLNAEVKHFLNHAGLSSPKHMDELTQLRKARLKALIDGKPYLGNQSAFAAKAGLTKGRVSQLLDPAHSFGERAGMTLAASLGLSERYFDSDQDGTANEMPAGPQAAQTEHEQIAQSLEVITKALMNVDEFTRDLVRHSLSRLGKDPSESGNISHKIADLLVKAPSQSGAGNDRPRSVGKLIGGSALKDIGGTGHGRGDRDAAQGGRKG
jgi:hypothetical protein